MAQNTPTEPTDSYNSPEATLRPPMNAPIKLKHSGSIASFLTSLYTIIMLICGLGACVYAFVAGMVSLNGEMGETFRAAMIIVLAMFVFFVLKFIVLILKFVAWTWTQTDRKSMFGILGTFFSTVVILGMIGMIAVWLAMV